MKKSKKLTKERGSIALFLLVSILFFIIIGYSIYANVANSLSAQEKEIKAIQKNYQENSTEEIMDEKYEELLDGKIRIVFHVQSTGELYKNDKWINQNLIMTIYYPEEVPEDERYFSINGDKKKYEGEYIIEENCTISSEYENIRTKVEVSMIDKILPTVNIEPNGGIYKMPGSGTATIEVKLTTKDEGGSGIDKREYAWSTSETEEPKEGWKEFESGEVIKKTDCMEGTYYLWTKVTDVAGNGVEKKSEEYKVEKLENPIEVANKTVKVGETVDLSTLVSKAQGELSYEIKSQSTQGSSVAGKSLKVGENSATEDNDKTIVIIVTAGGNSNYNEGIKEIVITVQKYKSTQEH